MASCSKDKKRSSKHKSKKKDKYVDEVKALKHYDTFYNQAPPGLIKEEEEHPEDCIPDLPENKDAREFLAKAPSKGLWMPLGKEVKVMKCWRCKTYGHRTGDRECPLFVSGNAQIEKFRFVHEDPMHNFITEKRKAEKLERVQQLQALLAASDSSSSSSSDSGKRVKKKRRKSTSSSSESDRRVKKKRKKSNSSPESDSRVKKKKKKYHHKHSKKKHK